MSGNRWEHGDGKTGWKDINHSVLFGWIASPVNSHSTLNLEDYQATDLVASSCFFQQRLRMFAVLYSILSCLVVRSSMTFCWHMQGHRELEEDRHVTQCHFIIYATCPPILMVLRKSGWSNHAIKPNFDPGRYHLCQSRNVGCLSPFWWLHIQKYNCLYTTSHTI